jgi:hypothetical protein
MTNIQDEKNAADEADAVVQNVSVSAVSQDQELAIQRLREANDVAINAAGANPLAQEHLNNARSEAAIALSALIDQLNGRSQTQDVIDRVRRALEDWKSRLAAT